MNAPTEGQLALAARLAAGGSSGAGGIAHVNVAAYTSPTRYAAERGAWREAMALDVKPSKYPFVDALTRYTRAIGAARFARFVREWKPGT